MPNTSPLLSVAAVAERLGVSPLFVYRAIKSGRLRHYQLGSGGQGAKRISEAQLAEFLAAAERGEPDEPAPRRQRRTRHVFKHLKGRV